MTHPLAAFPLTRRRCLGTLILLLPATAVHAQAAPDEAVHAFTEVCSRVLGLRFDDAQRQRIRGFIDDYWRQRQHQAMDGVLASVGFLAQLREQPGELLDVALRMTRPTMLRDFEKEAAGGDALARWLLEQYHRLHPVLAPGKPGGLPLTRDSVDGELDLAHFMATEIHRQAARRPSAAEREQAYRAAAARHAGLSADQQFAVAQAPGEAARLRFGWQRASALDRLIGRAEMGGSLTPQEQAQVQQFLAGMNAQLQGLQAQQQSLLSGALAHMRQNSEIIMGRGTVWNPASNRWEQQGGIVTEFNGTVRVP